MSKHSEGKLELWTSNSYRRFGIQGGAAICEPITQPGDGHPDLYFRNGGAEGPDALRFLATWNACAGLPTDMLEDVGNIVIPARVNWHRLTAAIHESTNMLQAMATGAHEEQRAILSQRIAANRELLGKEPG